MSGGNCCHGAFQGILDGSRHFFRARRGLHAFACADKEGIADAVPQSLNSMTNCGLRHAQTFGGPADMALRVDRTEHPEQIEIKLMSDVHK